LDSVEKETQKRLAVDGWTRYLEVVSLILHFCRFFLICCTVDEIALYLRNPGPIKICILSLMKENFVRENFRVVKDVEGLYQSVFHCQNHALLTESEFSNPLAEAFVWLQVGISIVVLGGRVDAKFVFMGDFSCAQKSRPKHWPEDQINDGCSKRGVHFLLFIIICNYRKIITKVD